MLRYAGKTDYSSVEEVQPIDQCFDERPVHKIAESRCQQGRISQATAGTTAFTLRDMLASRLNAALDALTMEHQLALMLVDEFNDNFPATAVLPGTLSNGDESVVTKAFDELGEKRNPSKLAVATVGHEVETTERPSMNFLVADQFQQSRQTSQIKTQSEKSSVENGHRSSMTSNEDDKPPYPSENKQARNSPRKGNQRPIRRPEAVFADVIKMKEQVKEALRNPEYNVADYYKTDGMWQAIATHVFFDNITLFVIALNSIWIAIDTDHNHSESWAESHWAFILGENFFCTYFLGELVIRFMAFDDKRNCLRDAWFVFDSALVIMMVGESWIMNFMLWITNSDSSGGLGSMNMLRLVRLLRLTRMLRMARLMRAIPELMILLKGISAATRSVFFTLCLLVLLIYVFAIAFTQLCEDTDLGEEYFPTVPKAMNNLLLKGTLPDQAAFVEDGGNEGWVFAFLMLLFILLSTLTVLNMLVGVLVEVVGVVSAVEKEQMTVNFVKSELGAMLLDTKTDKNGNKHINKMEFLSLLRIPVAARIIKELGVDVAGLVDYADFIFDKKTELSFPEFMELVMQLRGQEFTTVKDMVDIRKFMTKSFQDLVQDTVQDVEIIVRNSEFRTMQRLEGLARGDGSDKHSLRPSATVASMVPSPAVAVAVAPMTPAPELNMQSD